MHRLNLSQLHSKLFLLDDGFDRLRSIYFHQNFKNPFNSKKVVEDQKK